MFPDPKLGSVRADWDGKEHLVRLGLTSLVLLFCLKRMLPHVANCLLMTYPNSYGGTLIHAA